MQANDGAGALTPFCTMALKRIFLMSDQDKARPLKTVPLNVTTPFEWLQTASEHCCSRPFRVKATTAHPYPEQQVAGPALWCEALHHGLQATRYLLVRSPNKVSCAAAHWKR